MPFRFQVDITEQVYLDFNMFGLLKTDYGRSNLRKMRVTFTVLVAMLILLVLLLGGFSTARLLSCIPMVLVWALFMWLFPRLLVSGVKANVADMKKKGKLSYDPHAELVFYEEHFEEITPDKRATQAYTTIEKVYVNGDKAIYLHMDAVRAFIVPMTAFESKEQFGQFLTFLRAKLPNADVCE